MVRLAGFGAARSETPFMKKQPSQNPDLECATPEMLARALLRPVRHGTQSRLRNTKRPSGREPTSVQNALAKKKKVRSRGVA